MQLARFPYCQARSSLLPFCRSISRLPSTAMASSVEGSDVSKAHQAANQAGEEATRGTTPAKLQSAAAKGYNAEQTAQSLEDAPRADINDPKIPTEVKSKLGSASTNGSAASGTSAGSGGAVTGSEVSAAHKASSQGGAGGTEQGTLPSKLQSAAAKGRTPEQLAQSLSEAPNVDPNDAAIPQEVKAKMNKA